MISVIIPAHNEADYLPITLRSVLIAMQHLTIPVEIVVANDASTDGTDIVARETGAKVVDVNLRHIAAVRNAGARAAEGDLFVFLDADTRLPIDTLRAAYKAYRNGCVGGGCRVAFDRELTRIERALLRSWDVHSRMFRWAAGSFLFARRSAFVRIGGFDERFYAGEEVFTSEAFKRLGPFTILDEHIVTSSRKLDAFSPVQMLRPIVRGAMTLGRSLHRRDKLGLWYETPRGASGEGRPP